MRAVATWSGGKDSGLAVFKARKEGIAASVLFNLQAADTRHSAFGDVPAGLIRLQAELAGLPLHQSVISDSMDAQSYYAHYCREVGRLAASDGARALISGNIDARLPHGEMMDRLCAFHGLKLAAPLRGRGRESVLADLRRLGFTAVICMVNTDVLDKEWVGRPLDDAFLSHVRQKGAVDLCGEHGEYDTVVTGGPLFSRPIEILRTRKVLEPPHCRLDILAFR